MVLATNRSPEGSKGDEEAMEDRDYAKLILDIVPKSMRTIRREMRMAAKAELTVPQFRVFNRLSASVATNSELANWMGVSPSTMSRMVDSLVRRKLVHRMTEEGDRRQVKLQLTAKGESRYKAISGMVRSKIARMVASVRDREKEQLIAGLNVLNEILR